jgi:predicted ATPase
MHLHELHVRNYMVHRDTRVKLSPLTVFVGPHGGGKSALFDAILNFSMVSRGNLRQAFGPYPYSFRATIHRGASNVSRIGYTVTMSRYREDAARLMYEIDYRQAGAAVEDPQFTIPNERVLRRPDDAVLFDRDDPDAYPVTQTVTLEDDQSLFAAIRHAELAGKLQEVDPLLLYSSQQISRFSKFRLDPGVLGQPSRLPDPARAVAPRIGYHGEDLAATLYHLSETADPALDEIRDRMRAIEPSFVDFEFRTVGTERIVFASKYSDARQAVPAVRLSSGTLLYLGLIVLVSTPSRPPVLMIEEPENGLTPQAVRSFYEAVRRLAYHENPELRSQILLSSHSPFVICEAWNGEDRDFIHQVKIADGRAVIRKFGDVVKEHGIQLRKDKIGERTVLGLATAEEVMAGYLA